MRWPRALLLGRCFGWLLGRLRSSVKKSVLAESATAGDRMQKLEQEIELLKQRLSVLEHEVVRDEAR